MKRIALPLLATLFIFASGHCDCQSRSIFVGVVKDVRFETVASSCFFGVDGTTAIAIDTDQAHILLACSNIILSPGDSIFWCPKTKTSWDFNGIVFSESNPRQHYDVFRLVYIPTPKRESAAPDGH